jgi:hypothetical protein
MAVIIDIDHETGDLSEYTATVEDSGDLSAQAGAALAGTNYGLQLVIDDTTAIYGYKSFANNTSGVCRSRFYINPNTLTATGATEIMLWRLYNSLNENIAYCRIYYVSGTQAYIYATIVGDTAQSSTNIYAITNAEHRIEINLIRATDADDSDGSLQLWIDGTSKETKSGIDNYDRFFDVARTYLGAITVSPNISGTFYLDELIINDDGSEIGPVSGGDLSINIAPSVPAYQLTGVKVGA